MKMMTPMQDPMLMMNQSMRMMSPVSSTSRMSMEMGSDKKMPLNQPLLGRVFKTWPVGAIPSVPNEDHLSLESEKITEFCFR